MKKQVIMGMCIGLSMPLSAMELSTGMKISKHQVIDNKISAHIVNGTNATFAENPHYVALTIIPDELMSDGGFSYFKTCGGSILNDRFILTAAHCVEDSVYDEINLNYGFTASWQNNYIIAGVSNIGNASTNNFYKVKSRHIHPSYGSIAGLVDEGIYLNGFEKYDIAVLELEEPILHNVGSIDFRGLNNSVYDQMDQWHATGMGLTSANGVASNQLLTTVLQPGNDSSGLCSYRYSKDTTICSIDTASTGSTCQGDSGGPITYKDNGKHIQIGVVSYGTNPCGTGMGVYTEISAYENWISTIVTHGESKDYVYGEGETPEEDTDGSGGSDGSGTDNSNSSEGGDSGGSLGLVGLLGLGLLARRRQK